MPLQQPLALMVSLVELGGCHSLPLDEVGVNLEVLSTDDDRELIVELLL